MSLSGLGVIHNDKIETKTKRRRVCRSWVKHSGHWGKGRGGSNKSGRPHLVKKFKHLNLIPRSR